MKPVVELTEKEYAEQWAEENPVKTYLSVLLEKFPNVQMNTVNGIPEFCPQCIFGGEVWVKCDYTSETCMKCWNREYKEQL